MSRTPIKQSFIIEHGIVQNSCLSTLDKFEIFIKIILFEHTLIIYFPCCMYTLDRKYSKKILYSS